MGTRRKQYTREFVVRAVRLAEESPRPISEVARDLGVVYGTLYDWMKRAGRMSRTKREAGPPSTATQTPEALLAENERLRRELEETKKQLEFAKKAAAFFAQQNK
jgi:transposase